VSRRLTTLPAATALGGSLSLVATESALAETVTLHDARGDAAGRYDLTTAKVKNSQKRLTVTTHVRDLRGDRTQIFGASISPVRSDASWTLYTVRRANGSTRAWLIGYVDDDTVIKSDCAIRRAWRPARDVIRVSVARECVTDNGPLRASLYIGQGDGSSGDPADWTRTVRVRQD
jgi:hypothetical protein